MVQQLATTHHLDRLRHHRCDRHLCLASRTGAVTTSQKDWAQVTTDRPAVSDRQSHLCPLWSGPLGRWYKQTVRMHRHGSDASAPWRHMPRGDVARNVEDARRRDKKAFNKFASKLRFDTRHFIDGKFVESKKGKKFESINPATGEIIAEVARGDASDVDLAVKA